MWQHQINLKGEKLLIHWNWLIHSQAFMQALNHWKKKNTYARSDWQSAYTGLLARVKPVAGNDLAFQYVYEKADLGKSYTACSIWVTKWGNSVVQGLFHPEEQPPAAPSILTGNSAARHRGLSSSWYIADMQQQLIDLRKAKQGLKSCSEMLQGTEIKLPHKVDESKRVTVTEVSRKITKSIYLIKMYFLQEKLQHNLPWTNNPEMVCLSRNLKAHNNGKRKVFKTGEKNQKMLSLPTRQKIKIKRPKQKLSSAHHGCLQILISLLSKSFCLPRRLRIYEDSGKLGIQLVWLPVLHLSKSLSGIQPQNPIS